MGKPLSSAKFFDFAVIWDGDHDERVLLVIERLYQSGLLPAFAFFGEHEGRLTAIPSEQISDERRLFLEEQLRSCCYNVADDSWSCCVVSVDDPNNEIIVDDQDQVKRFLAEIRTHRHLGPKEIGSDGIH